MVKGKRNKAWIFLKPLCWDLWLMTPASFVFTCTVVWALEHRINEEFRGPLAHQIVLLLHSSLCIQFSTKIISTPMTHESIQNRGNVGYMVGSIVVDRLRSLHVEEPYLKPYKTAEKFAED
ncbi:glutamate receptor 2.9 isoform X2 [Cinnamomum micranthum f. kanehirae]|uniref:Glutamate receptor 2.9 isoform X2 n=1 Tax=Cinnamomum micranthum f. kanehirae TaxID=337451 RepID=A0A443NA36_9MAGN|nr:glutamate receptor 2.9 isoform X2 [Cinnamomum micranthum f. kanehirae]